MQLGVRVVGEREIKICFNNHASHITPVVRRDPATLPGADLDQCLAHDECLGGWLQDLRGAAPTAPTARRGSGEMVRLVEKHRFRSSAAPGRQAGDGAMGGVFLAAWAGWAERVWRPRGQRRGRQPSYAGRRGRGGGSSSCPKSTSTWQRLANTTRAPVSGRDCRRGVPYLVTELARGQPAGKN